MVRACPALFCLASAHRPWPGPDFDQDRIGHARSSLAQPVGEAHRLAQVAHPVFRIGERLRIGPGAGEVGDERESRAR